MAVAMEDDDLIKDEGEIVDTFSQISTKLAPCDWRSTLFQVESFTPSTESTAESDVPTQHSYHPDWYSVGYLTDGRYNSSLFLKVLQKPQICDEISPITRHSVLIFSESGSDYNVYFSTKVIIQAATVQMYLYRVPLSLALIEFTPTSFIASKMHQTHEENAYYNGNLKKPKSESLVVPMQIFFHRHLHRCKRQILPLKHRYPRVLRILPDLISALISTKVILIYSIRVHIEPIFKEFASTIEKKHWRLEDNLIVGRMANDVKRLRLPPLRTLEVCGSMQKTVRSLRLVSDPLSSEERTVPYLETVDRVRQKAPLLTSSKVLLGHLKTVSLGSEIGQCVSGSHLKAPPSSLRYHVAKPFASQIVGRALIQECLRPNALQPSPPYSQKEGHLMQQIEVIPNNVVEVEVISEKTYADRPKNRSPPGDSASPCLSFYLIPEKRPSGQITLDVNCCPASSNAVIDSLPVDGANRVECRFLKLIAHKARRHRHKPPRLRAEECNVATPSPPQNYCAITLSD